MFLLNYIIVDKAGCNYSVCTYNVLYLLIICTYMHVLHIRTYICSRAETNINIHEYLLILVVFVKKNLVTNTHYIMLWTILDLP